MKAASWRQCELRSGSRVLVSWVPEEHARAGRRLELKDEPGTIWTVTKAYAERRRLSEINRGWDNNI